MLIQRFNEGEFNISTLSLPNEKTIKDIVDNINNNFIEENNFCRFCVYDRKVYGNEVTEWMNKRSLEEFLRENNPKLLRNLKEYISE